MEEFYKNILKQYHENKAWDRHPNEALTVGSLSRRFWEQASNHYHESDLANQLALLNKPYPNGPPFPAGAAMGPPLFKDYIRGRHESPNQLFGNRFHEAQLANPALAAGRP